MLSLRIVSRSAVVLVALVVIVLVTGLTRGSATSVPDAAAATTVTVDRGTASGALPSGFLSFSIEFWNLESYTGTDPKAVDPVFVQLLRDMDPSQTPILRIGGDSTDWTWWPVPGMRKSPGIRFVLNPLWAQMARALADAAPAKLILGVNLEQDSTRVSDMMASQLVKRIGSLRITGLELGNEPELYPVFAWYQSHGKSVYGRSQAYGQNAYMADYRRIAATLPKVPLAGPAIGAPQWLAQLGTFLGSEPAVATATIHAYPLKKCTKTTVITNNELLSNASSHGFATTLRPFVAMAHNRHRAIRVAEMNAVSCGGAKGVSDTFGSALWALDTLFEVAETGVQGVNFHTRLGGVNEILGPSFSGGHWQMLVHPEFYGMMMFAQANPVGSHILKLSGLTPPPNVKVWATRDRSGTIRVVAINKRQVTGATVQISIPAAGAAATTEVLRAPSVHARLGVTLGGQSFGAETRTGLLPGKPRLGTLKPRGRTYTVHLVPASATMLTISTR